MNIAIIGAGASALFLSALLKNKHNIVLFERNKKIASKLLASGNGRCNLLNLNANPKSYNNCEFMEKVFSRYNVFDIKKIFERMGLEMISDDEGRVYPISLISETVLDILLDNIDAKIELNYIVNRITKVGSKYQINDYNILFDKVVLASGSSASIVNDKQELCYNYLKSLDLKTTKLNPSLVGFKSIKLFKEISGVRSKAKVSLYADGKIIHTEDGEVIFKDDGISGIVVMNMSSYYSRLNPKKAYLSLDLLEGLNPSNLKGALNPKLYRYVTSNHIDIHSFIVDIKSTYDIKDAQVVNGGVDIKSIDDFFRLRKDNNIYLMGEMLDIDGVCGGYNLSFAFLSALIVGSDFGYEN